MNEAKKVYAAPSVQEYGDIESITRMGSLGNVSGAGGWEDQNWDTDYDNNTDWDYDYYS